MIAMYYKINREKSSFNRTQLTKLGWVSLDIDCVYTFKDNDDNRYLLVTFVEYPSKELEEQIDKKVKAYGDLDKIPATHNLDELFQTCLARAPGTKYLIHYERARYRTSEELAN